MQRTDGRRLIRRLPIGVIGVTVGAFVVSALAVRALIVGLAADGGPPPIATHSPITAQAALAQTCSVDAAMPTPAQTEGPYFKAGSPERTDLLEPGVAGTPLVLTGRVLTTSGQPIPGAVLDFWQADGNGAYDNRGYQLRGHQYADDNGQYTLSTVVPGEYPGRTPHIHVKVQAPGGPVLTTQLYLPDEPQNARDGIFSPTNVMTVQDGPDGKLATFDFVLR